MTLRFHRPRLRSLSLLACALALSCAACTTEVRSLTGVRAELEFGPDLAPIWFTMVAIGSAQPPATLEEAEAVDKLEVQWNGEPVLISGERPLTLRAFNAALSYYMPAGSGSFSFVRGGQTVATSGAIELAPDRYNYLIVYGDPSEPDVLVVDGPREQRRLRIANVHKSGADIEFSQLDGDDQPLGDPTVLPYGEVYSELAHAAAARVSFTAADGSKATWEIDCDPTFTLVAYDVPSTASPKAMIGLRPPRAPMSEEDALSHCYDLDCGCEPAEPTAQ